MSRLRMFGLAAVAAVASMAFAGGGDASATVLCKTPVENCPGAWDYPANTEFHPELSSITLEIEVGSEIQDRCDEATVHGSTENTGSATETVKVPVSTVFLHCDHTTKVIANGSLEVHAEGDGGGGSLTSKQTQITVVFASFGGISCVLNTGTGTKIGILDPSPNATSRAKLTVNATVPVSGFLCPSTVKLTAEYTLASPLPLDLATG